MFTFVWNYALLVTIFGYCYAHIFHTIRRQSKVMTSHHTTSSRRDQDVPMANTGQVQQQQQSTGSTTGAKLSRTELNILQTMIAVTACFIFFWTPITISNVARSYMV